MKCMFNKTVLSWVLSILLLSSSVVYGAYTLTAYAESTVEQGKNLGVEFTITSNNSEAVTNHFCKVWTAHNASIDMIELQQYDPLLESPLTLKTDAGGKAYALFEIGTDYGANQSFQVTGNCNGTVSTSRLFEVKPYSPLDVVASFLFSFNVNAGAWVGILFALLIGGVVLIGIYRFAID